MRDLLSPHLAFCAAAKTLRGQKCRLLWKPRRNRTARAMCVAQISTVFAQLTVGGKWQGPHVFVVRLRDRDGNCTPGVRIKDNGHKAGLNGVDNGQIWWVFEVPSSPVHLCSMWGRVRWGVV